MKSKTTGNQKKKFFYRDSFSEHLIAFSKTKRIPKKTKFFGFEEMPKRSPIEDLFVPDPDNYQAPKECQRVERPIYSCLSSSVELRRRGCLTPMALLELAQAEVRRTYPDIDLRRAHRREMYEFLTEQESGSAITQPASLFFFKN